MTAPVDYTDDARWEALLAELSTAIVHRIGPPPDCAPEMHETAHALACAFIALAAQKVGEIAQLPATARGAFRAFTIEGRREAAAQRREREAKSAPEAAT
jgi:hypothetical protein